MASRAPEFSAAVPALAAERPVTWPKRTRTRLPNGLQVVLAEAHSIPKFHGELYFRAGNAQVSDRSTGLAEMTATLVRTGTAHRASRQLEEDLRRLGADLGSSAGQDTSAIGFGGLSEFAEPLLQLVNELAREASFPENEFERERRQKLEEVKLERTSPGFLAGERLRKVLFGAHPYAQISPSEAQVAAYKREDLQSVYREFYTPEDALLMLVGDFDPQAMLKLIEKTFGTWPGKKAAPKEFPSPPKPQGRRVYLVHNPGSVQTQILAGCHAITRQHPDWVRLGLANSLYGGAFNSRLVMNIREDKGYTYSPRSSVHPLRQHGYFSVSAAVRNDVVAASLTEIFYEIDKLRSVPVPESELADAQNYLTGVFSLGLASQDSLLSQFSTVELNELPADYLETYRDKVRAVTPADLMAVARQYFDSANMQIVIVGDRAQIEPQAAIFGPLEIFDTQGNRTE
jgi:zinc protease